MGALVVEATEREQAAVWVPPPCEDSYGNVFSVHLAVDSENVVATYTAEWDGEPAFGWVSDNAIPVNQGPIYQGSPVSWTYPRVTETQRQFGFLSLSRQDGTRCEVRIDFDVPGLGRRPRT
jgi:hypothetical protein